MIHSGRAGVVAAVMWWAASTSFSAEPFVAFGLTNVALGNASAGPGISEIVRVNNIGTNGNDGISIYLGEADSGVFVYPATDMDPANGSFLRGHVYGRVNGESNRLICSMRGNAESDGHHPVEIDFAPLGSTHFTYLLFRDGQLVAQTGPQEGTMAVYGTYFDPLYPRVNPFWRMADGSVGAIIEFAGDAPMSLPGVGDVTGDRVVIRADNATNVVDFASRLDVTGGGPLEWFEIQRVGLGMFKRPHFTILGALLQARAGKLTVSGSGPDVAIELDKARRFAVALEPIELGTNASFTAMGVGIGTTVWDPLGAVRLKRNGASLEMNAELGSTLTNVEVIAYLNGVEVERASGTNAFAPATTRLVGVEWNAKTTNGPAGIGLRMEQSVSITLPNQSVYVADEIRFVITGFDPFVALENVALHATGLTEFTITAEVEEPFTAPQLNIVRLQGQAQISWTDPNHLFMLQAAACFDCGFYAFISNPTYDGDTAQAIVDTDSEEVGPRLFRLALFPELAD